MANGLAQEQLSLFRQKIGEIKDLHSAVSLLHWDQEVYMPPKAAGARGQQLATLSSLAHRMFTDASMGDLLKELKGLQDRLSPDEAKMVDEALYDYEKATKLPESFIHEFSIEQAKAYEAWVKARQDSTFSLFQPHLQRMVELLRRKADFYGYIGSPYNALLEEYERGMSTEAVQNIFATLANEQSVLVNRIASAPHQPDTQWLHQAWDKDKQWILTLRVIQQLGFDMEAGRQDLSLHPFSTSFALHDVRITTRLNDNELFSGLTGSMHETGHALYEQGFCEEDARTPLADSISLGIHESQSRLWENMIGRSLPFWRYCTPIMKEHFGEQLKETSPELVYDAINEVKPSFIRVEADECTYNLHVILRFEIELGLIEGDIEVSDVPAIWNEKMKDYLGLDVPSDDLGCLQDIHWSHGSMGYFPTYALGNLYAAQMFEVIEKDIPNLWQRVEQGNFAPLLVWLREHVHRVGRRKTAPELIQDISGKTLSPEPFLRYLKRKYGELYRLQSLDSA